MIFNKKKINNRKTLHNYLKIKNIPKEVKDVVGEEEVKQIKKTIIPKEMQIYYRKTLHNYLKIKKIPKKVKDVVREEEVKQIKKTIIHNEMKI